MSDNIVTWNITPADSWAALVQAQVNAIEADIVTLADSLTDQVAAWMKENARWTDQTGAARAGLYADIIHVAHEAVYLLMSHNVTLEYTWYLETAFAGRYSILDDTVDFWWPVFYRGVVEILRRHSS